MNAFADWLFSILLGWTGTVANSAWNAVMNASGGISTFFSRFWMPLVLLLVLGGVLMDYIVWFARWRPYLVWRSWLTRKRRQRMQATSARQLEEGEMDPDTLDTIADWVATPQDQYPVYDLPGTLQEEPWAASHPNWASPQQSDPWASMPAQQEIPSVPPAEESWQPAPQQFSPEQQPYSAEPPPVPKQPFPYDQPEQKPYNWFAQQDRQPAQPTPASPTRRRRSERNRQSHPQQILNRLRSRFSQPEEDVMIDGLPSPVREEDAFHEAVYPPNYHYTPSYDQQLTDRQQEDEQNGT